MQISGIHCINPFPNDKLYSSKLKEFADDNFKFDENGRKLSKRVENTVGKGEIACDEQFLLFPLCFQKACFSGASKGVIVWEWVNQSAPNLVHMCMTIRSRMSLIMELIGPELSELSALELENLPYLTLFTL